MRWPCGIGTVGVGTVVSGIFERWHCGVGTAEVEFLDVVLWVGSVGGVIFEVALWGWHCGKWHCVVGTVRGGIVRGGIVGDGTVGLTLWE